MTAARSFSSFESPLVMVLSEPRLHQFIDDLARRKEELESRPGKQQTLTFSRSYLEQVRQAFRTQILKGENNLHQLAHLLSSCFFYNEFELHSNVIGVLPGGERPFMIRERILRQDLLSLTDLDLGNQMIGNFRYQHQGEWKSLVLSANFVEYIPSGKTLFNINRITSRVKAEEEIWNKVTDELFHIDQLIRRDKQLRQYSKYVKDVFGVKVVCESDRDCKVVQEVLEQDGLTQISWLSRVRHQGRKVSPVKFIETKDYLFCPPEAMKKTGWKAIKSVVKWNDHLFEIQFQPLSNYYLELDHMAEPSHRSFKLNRDQMREELSRHLPFYGFFRDLLRMVFMEKVMEFDHPVARVILTD
ncbi:MAG: hypothetical protein HUU10_12030 [Bacteroidetes bacterium]|nr:hypothetical protein [Bacteroidota bacterium]